MSELPDYNKLWELSEEYAYKKCNLQNFFEEDEIIIIRTHWCNAYIHAIRDFVDKDYNPFKKKE